MIEDKFPFRFNKYMYDSQIKASINMKDARMSRLFKGLNELIQFAIVLPFELPLAQTGFFSRKIKDSGRDRILFFFNEVSINTPIFSGVYREHTDNNFYESKRILTRVEFNVLKEEFNTFDDEIATVIYEKCLSHLNSLIMAYKIEHGDSSVYQITREMLLTPIVIMTWRNVLDFNNEKDRSLLVTNTPQLIKKDELTEYETFLLDDFAGNVIDKERNPFVSIEDVAFEARRQLNNGFYRNAVVLAQTSIETFTYQVYRLIRKDKKNYQEFSFDRIKRNTRGLAGLLEQILFDELSRKWERNDYSNPLGKWHKNTYVLRNKVIHDGYNPDFNEATDAVESAVDLRYEFLLEFNKKKEAFPSIQQYYKTPVR